MQPSPVILKSNFIFQNMAACEHIYMTRREQQGPVILKGAEDIWWWLENTDASFIPTFVSNEDIFITLLINNIYLAVTATHYSISFVSIYLSLNTLGEWFSIYASQSSQRGPTILL